MNTSIVYHARHGDYSQSSYILVWEDDKGICIRAVIDHEKRYDLPNPRFTSSAALGQSLIILTALLAASTLLVACGEQKFTAADLNKAAFDAASAATLSTKETEAKLIDGKWASARTQLNQLGKETARKGDFRLLNNCAVLPNGFSQMEAAITFPSSASDQYRSACKDEVYVMKRERDQARVAEQQRLARAERTKQQKLAAAKQKPAHKSGAVKPTAHKPSAG